MQGTEHHHNANDINGLEWLMNKSDSHLYFSMSLLFDVISWAIHWAPLPIAAQYLFY